MRSLVSIEQQSPSRPCDILAPNKGPEIVKTAKTVILLINCKMWHFTQKPSKCVQSQKWQKQHFQGLANKVPARECAKVFCVCQSVSPAVPGPDRRRSLVQPSPAFSSWFQPGQGPGALPNCSEVQGECPVSRELPREVARPRSPSQCPGMCPGEAQAMCYSSP